MMLDSHDGLHGQPPYKPTIGPAGTHNDQISLLARLGLDPYHNGHTYRVIYEYDPGSPTIKATKDQVSRFMWLRSQRFPVPRIVAYDFGNHNEIASPYLVETICSGRSTAQIYGGLCQEEKKQVLDAVAAVIVQKEAATFERWGKLVACSSHDPLVPM